MDHTIEDEEKEEFFPVFRQLHLTVREGMRTGPLRKEPRKKMIH